MNNEYTPDVIGCFMSCLYLRCTTIPLILNLHFLIREFYIHNRMSSLRLQWKTGMLYADTHLAMLGVKRGNRHFGYYLGKSSRNAAFFLVFAKVDKHSKVLKIELCGIEICY